MIKKGAGHFLMASAGSVAVRSEIEKHQPLIGIHDHIRESSGEVKIGRTQRFNPGSEYGAGILKGFFCELNKNKIKSRMFTSG